MPIKNFNLNHVALSVPRLEDAIKFYTSIFGLRQIRDIMKVKVQGSQPENINTIYGNELKEVRIAFLSASNSVGLELFEFSDPPYSGATAPGWSPENYTRGGVFHFAFTDTDPLGTVAKAVSLGAKRVGEAVTLPNGTLALYFSDPWGNVVELVSAPFDQIWLPVI